MLSYIRRQERFLTIFLIFPGLPRCKYELRNAANQAFSGTLYEVAYGLFELAEGDSFRTLFGDFVKRSSVTGQRAELLCIFALFETKTVSRSILISKGAELVRVPVEHLVFIQAEGNYSHLVTRDGRRTLISYQLGQIEDIIEEQRVHFPDKIIIITFDDDRCAPRTSNNNLF